MIELNKYEKYKFSYRLLIFKDKNFKSKKMINSTELFDENKYEFHKRNIKLIKEKCEDNCNFIIYLVGFDGKIKKKYKNFDYKKILKDVDDMPMSKLKKNDKKLSLYENYKKETTINGLGFKDKEKALYTIKKIKDKPINYQKQVIITMYNRAKFHPNQTKEMKDAMKIFEEWLELHKND